MCEECPFPNPIPPSLPPFRCPSLYTHLQDTRNGTARGGLDETVDDDVSSRLPQRRQYSCSHRNLPPHPANVCSNVGTGDIDQAKTDRWNTSTSTGTGTSNISGHILRHVIADTSRGIYRVHSCAPGSCPCRAAWKEGPASN